ncbi:hypothetical protein TRFO_23304 [Tritrichomonas foetus]|uniref:Uncharacterized protein n=1 Tax=Tritrichomonas foetus TaxID=1144522 RepID=A0A1J4KFV8_9EUKA|nr:hypothetical protein TRFO_23304 [Tritrichomonas foetus]|eukprot:OHT08229.1 hypothetical protein TRFO_23304 [Tritrichomonas foetus]
MINDKNTFEDYLLNIQIDRDKENYVLKFAQDNSLSSQCSIFIESFSIIIKSVVFAVPPEVFQFVQLIKTDNSQITPENAIKYEIIPFIIQMLTLDTPLTVLSQSLNIINTFCYYSDILLKVILRNHILEFLPQIFSYPDPSFCIQTHISILFVNLTNYMDIPHEVILECARIFTEQAIIWAVNDKEENFECQKNCLTFLFNVIVGSEKNLTIEYVRHISKFAFSILVSNNIALLSLAAYILVQIISNYELILEPSDIFNSILWNYIKTEAASPVLRLACETLNTSTEFPTDIKIIWELLIEAMLSENIEVSSLACRLAKCLINGGIEVIEEALQKGILDVSTRIMNDGSFKAMKAITMMIRNILIIGNIQQQKLIFNHSIIISFLKFIEGYDSDEAALCMSAMNESVKAIIGIDTSFVNTFKQNIPFELMSTLLVHSNDNVCVYTKMILESLGVE